MGVSGHSLRAPERKRPLKICTSRALPRCSAACCILEPPSSCPGTLPSYQTLDSSADDQATDIRTALEPERPRFEACRPVAGGRWQFADFPQDCILRLSPHFVGLPEG